MNYHYLVSGSLAKVKMVCLTVLSWEVNHSRIELPPREMHSSRPSPCLHSQREMLVWIGQFRNPDVDRVLFGGFIT